MPRGLQQMAWLVLLMYFGTVTEAACVSGTDGVHQAHVRGLTWPTGFCGVYAVDSDTCPDVAVDLATTAVEVASKVACSGRNATASKEILDSSEARACPPPLQTSQDTAHINHMALTEALPGVTERRGGWTRGGVGCARGAHAAAGGGLSRGGGAEGGAAGGLWRLVALLLMLLLLGAAGGRVVARRVMHRPVISFLQRNLRLPHALPGMLLPVVLLSCLIGSTQATVGARVLTGTPSFAVNWLSDTGDILFHFNPRVRLGRQDLIVMNARANGGSWGPEEYLNFGSGQAEATWHITVDTTGFRVLADGNQLHMFLHRLPWSSFSRVESGNVAIQSRYRAQARASEIEKERARASEGGRKRKRERARKAER